MSCYHPMDVAFAWKSNPSGKHSVVFRSSKSYIEDYSPGTEFVLPCGKCIGCRIDRSRQWALRCVHEASLHKSNCFLTLTYSPEHLPPNGSLRPRDFVLFMKRLRFRFGEGIRFFHCGEYGSQLQRPHHHVCLFNFDPSDKKFHSRNCLKQSLYISPSLAELWPYGFHLIGDVSFQSAAYVARYITKKKFGKDAEDHYGGRIPEYITMSRRPGIGKEWFDKFKDDVYPSDFVLMGNKKLKPPRYYDKLYELISPESLASIKERRKDQALSTASEMYPDRLYAREQCKISSFNRLLRGYENVN